MFRRLLFENWVMVFPLVAFITAVSVYVNFVYRALRMRRAQVAHCAQLPFNDKPDLNHD
jgi:hypothetical protein